MNDKLTTIGAYAFADCKSLTDLKLGSKVTSVGGHAFENCTSLANLNIPASVKSLGDCAFKNDTALSNITINGDINDCSGYSTWNGEYAYYNYYAYSSNHSVFYNAGTNSTSFVVEFADGVTKVPAYLFATGEDADKTHEAAVTKVIFADSVVEIGKCAFSRCYDLEDIQFGKGALTIDENAFELNTKLKTVTFGSNTTELKGYSFTGCTNLKTVNMNDNLTTIGEGAFSKCAALTDLKLGSKLTTIGKYAFESCTSLANINIPASVKNLGDGAFRNDTALSNITINGDINDCSGYSTWNGEYAYYCYYAYSSNHAAFYNAGTASSGIHVTFGAKVTKVPAYLFATGEGEAAVHYANVVEVTLGEKVKEVGNYAFYNCFELNKLTVNSNATFAENSAVNLKSGVVFNCYYGTKTADYANGLKYKVSYLTPKTPELKTLENAATGVKLTWKSALGAKEYEVYRSTGTSSSKTKIATVTKTSYVDTKAASGKSYKYYVVAKVSDKNKSEFSGRLSIKALTTPTIKSFANTSSGVKITWKKVAGANGYTIYSKKDGAKSYKQIAKITNGNTTSYVDKAAVLGQSTIYKIVAYTNDKDSASKVSLETTRKNTFQKAVANVAVSNKTKSTITVTFKKSTGVSGYQVEYSTTKDFKKYNTVTVKSSAKSASIKGLKKGQTYYVRVRSYKDYSESNGDSFSPYSEVKKIKVTK